MKIKTFNKIHGKSLGAIYRRGIIKVREGLGTPLFIPKYTSSKKINNNRLLIGVTYGLGDVILAASIVPHIRRLNSNNTRNRYDLLMSEYHLSLVPILENVFDNVIVIPEKEYIGRVPLPYELLKISEGLEWQERYLSHYTNEPFVNECEHFFEVICSRYNLPADTKPCYFDVPDSWVGLKMNQIMLNLTANSLNYNTDWSSVLMELDRMCSVDTKFIINSNTIINFPSNSGRVIEWFSGSFGQLIKESLQSTMVIGTRSGLNDVLGVLRYDNQIIFYPTNTNSIDFYKLSKMGFELPRLKEYPLSHSMLEDFVSEKNLFSG